MLKAEATMVNKMNKAEVFYPVNQAAWREWLAQNHVSKQSVWPAFYSKSSNKTSITWSEAVDGALCFGWLDSRKIKTDDARAHQFCSKRKPKSAWSKVHQDKVARP